MCSQFDKNELSKYHKFCIEVSWKKREREREREMSKQQATFWKRAAVAMCVYAYNGEHIYRSMMCCLMCTLILLSFISLTIRKESFVLSNRQNVQPQSNRKLLDGIYFWGRINTILYIYSHLACKNVWHLREWFRLCRCCRVTASLLHTCTRHSTLHGIVHLL